MGDRLLHIPLESGLSPYKIWAMIKGNKGMSQILFLRYWKRKSSNSHNSLTSKWSILSCQKVVYKSQTENLRHVTHFPWLCHTYCVDYGVVYVGGGLHRLVNIWTNRGRYVYLVTHVPPAAYPWRVHRCKWWVTSNQSNKDGNKLQIFILT